MESRCAGCWPAAGRGLFVWRGGGGCILRRCRTNARQAEIDAGQQFADHER